jgi:hypothetical protein
MPPLNKLIQWPEITDFTGDTDKQLYAQFAVCQIRRNEKSLDNLPVN